METPPSRASHHSISSIATEHNTEWYLRVMLNNPVNLFLSIAFPWFLRKEYFAASAAEVSLFQALTRLSLNPTTIFAGSGRHRRPSEPIVLASLNQQHAELLCSAIKEQNAERGTGTGVVGYHYRC